MVKAATEKMKRRTTNPAKYITHFRLPLLKLEITKNPDSKTGDKDESICKMPPMDNDTPGSKLDNIADLMKLSDALFCG